MALQAKEFQAGSGRWYVTFPDLLGTGNGNTIIQDVMELSEGDFCILLQKYGAEICPNVSKLVIFSWDSTDLAKCRKFKNWLNKEFRERKVSIRRAKNGEYRR